MHDSSFPEPNDLHAQEDKGQYRESCHDRVQLRGILSGMQKRNREHQAESERQDKEGSGRHRRPQTLIWPQILSGKSIQGHYPQQYGAEEEHIIKISPVAQVEEKNQVLERKNEEDAIQDTIENHLGKRVLSISAVREDRQRQDQRSL